MDGREWSACHDVSQCDVVVDEVVPMDVCERESDALCNAHRQPMPTLLRHVEELLRPKEALRILLGAEFEHHVDPAVDLGVSEVLEDVFVLRERRHSVHLTLQREAALGALHGHRTTSRK